MAPKIDISDCSTEQLYKATHVVCRVLGTVPADSMTEAERRAFEVTANTIERLHPDVMDTVTDDE